MVEIFTDNINKALDEVAPLKTFTVKSNYRFGLSQETKDLMKQRDSTRANIKNVSGNKKIVQMAKYKHLIRNFLIHKR